MKTIELNVTKMYNRLWIMCIFISLLIWKLAAYENPRQA